MSDAQKKRFTECSPLQQMMLIVFSRILHQRKFYDEGYFFKHNIHGVSLPLIDWTNPFVDQVITKSIMGAAIAADLRYVRTLQMVFKFTNDNPECFVERYAIGFDEDNIPRLVSPSRRASLSPPIDQSWSRDALLDMAKSVDEICADLDLLPTGRIGRLEVRFRLDYNDNSPKGYQAPNFERSEIPTLYFSDRLPSLRDQMPPPKRSLSSKEDKVQSTLFVQSLLSRRNSAPARTFSQRSLQVTTTTDASIGTPHRRSQVDEKKEKEKVPTPDDVKDLQKAVLGDDEFSDEDEEEPEEIEITRGEQEEGRERRKRSIDGDDEMESKKSRSSSSFLSEEKRDVTYLSTSLEVGNDTRRSPPSSESPENSSKTIAPPAPKGDTSETDGEGSQEDLDGTMDSDGGEPLDFP